MPRPYRRVHQPRHQFLRVAAQPRAPVHGSGDIDADS